MSAAISRTIWLPVLWEDDQDSVTLLGNNPLFYKGAELRFKIAIYVLKGALNTSSPGTFFDHSTLVAFIMKLYSSSTYASGLLLDTSDAAFLAAGVRVDFDATAQPTDFINRTKAPISIYLPANVMANVTPGTVYGALTGATSEAAGQPDGFGTFQAISKEIGLSTIAVAPTPGVEYVRTDVFQAALANKVSFGVNPRGRYPVIVNETGSYGTGIKTGPDGEFNPEQVTNP